MAARRGTTTQERDDAVLLAPVSSIDGDPLDGDQADQWAQFELLRDASESGEKGFVLWCYREPVDNEGRPTGGKLSFLFNAPIDAYDLSGIFDRVKNEFMPPGMTRTGIRIHVRKKQGTGIHLNQMFVVEKPAQTASATNTNDAALGQLASMIGDALNRQNQMIAELVRSQRTQPAADPFAGADKIVAMVTGLAGVLTKTSAPAGPAANSITDMISAIKQIRELSQDMAPEPRDEGGSGDANSIPAIMAAGKPYVEMLTALIQRAPNAPAPGMRRLPPPSRPLAGMTPARPNPNAAGSASVSPTIATPPPVNATMGSAAVMPQGDDPMLMLLAKHVSDICNLIEQGKAEPEGIARLILDAIPEQYDEKFYGIVADEFWQLKLAAVEPRVNAHAEFFGKVRAVILAEFADEEPPAEPTAS
ncbi:MAG: hypothetical protein AB7P97_20320 [Hyphomonadaceae bacterium]